MELDIKPTDKVCANCIYLLRMIAIGQGIRCGYEDGNYKPVPSFRHTCENFKNKHTDETN